MIHFPCKRLIAHILLFGQLLSSCQSHTSFHWRAIKHRKQSQPLQNGPLFIAPDPITYISKGGHKVHFKQASQKKWIASVAENLPKGFSRTFENLPIRCQNPYSVEILSNYTPAWHSRHIHVIFPSTKTGTTGLIYIGSMGLPGGAEGDATGEASNSHEIEWQAGDICWYYSEQNDTRIKATILKVHSDIRLAAYIILTVDNTDHLYHVSVPAEKFIDWQQQHGFDRNKQWKKNESCHYYSEEQQTFFSASVYGFEHKNIPYYTIQEHGANQEKNVPGDRLFPIEGENSTTSQQANAEESTGSNRQGSIQEEANIDQDQQEDQEQPQSERRTTPPDYQKMADNLVESSLMISDETLPLSLHKDTFTTLWSQIKSIYPPEELGNLLVHLQVLQVTYNLDIVTLNALLSFFTPYIDSQLTTLVDHPDNWLFQFRKNWLLTTHPSLHTTPRLLKYMSSLPWDAHQIQSLLDCITISPDIDKDTNPVLSCLIYMAKYQVPYVYFFQAIHPYQKAECPLPWSLIPSILSQYALSTQHTTLYSATPKLAPLLQHFLHDGIKHTHLDKHLTYIHERYEDAPSSEQKDLIEKWLQSLTLLSDHLLSPDVLISALDLLEGKDPKYWPEAIHDYLQEKVFKYTHTYDDDELIALLKEKSPAVSYLDDQISKDYSSLRSVYQSTSQLAPGKGPISQWNDKTIQHWSDAYKRKPNSVPITEQLAVIMRGVSIVHKITPRTTQLLSTLSLYHNDQSKSRGRIAQINTGEGKSLIIAMLAILHSLQGKKVDILTTSTELSTREAKEQSPLFSLFGLTVEANSPRKNGKPIADEIKKTLYQSDILYGTPSNFQGDILRTEFSGKDIRGNRGFQVAIVDEADSMLFDNRLNSTYLSEHAPHMTHLELPIAAAWGHQQRIKNHCIDRKGTIYFVKQDFITDGKEIQLFINNQSVKLSEEEESSYIIPLGSPVDQETLMIKNSEDYLNTLLRTPTAEESQVLNTKWKKAHDAYIQNEKNKNKQDTTAPTDPKEEKDADSSLPPTPFLHTPHHLRSYAQSQVPHWVKNIFYGSFALKKGWWYKYMME